MATRGQSKYMPHMRAKAIAGQMGAHRLVGDVVSQHEAMQQKAKTNTAKGQRGGDCNRTQCQRPGAWWYNKTMRSYYCGDCAGAINESCLYKDHIVSFGSMIYVNPPQARVVPAKDGQFAVEITTADGTVTHQTEFVTQDDAYDWAEHFWAHADLRRDGSPPFHYSELPQKMARLKALFDSMEEVKHSVLSDEHSVGRAQ